jgi:hypothetical protein
VIRALILALLCTQASAMDWVIHGLTHHTKPRPSGKEWHEVNPGIAARWTQGELAYQAGIYRDSIGKGTAYALADWEPWSYEGLRFGGFLGAKYNGQASGIVGFVAHRSNIGLRVFPAPKSKGIGVSIEFVF